MVREEMSDPEQKLWILILDVTYENYIFVMVRRHVCCTGHYHLKFGQAKAVFGVRRQEFFLTATDLTQSLSFCPFSDTQPSVNFYRYDQSLDNITCAYLSWRPLPSSHSASGHGGGCRSRAQKVCFYTLAVIAMLTLEHVFIGRNFQFVQLPRLQYFFRIFFNKLLS